MKNKYPYLIGFTFILVLSLPDAFSQSDEIAFTINNQINFNTESISFIPAKTVNQDIFGQKFNGDKKFLPNTDFPDLSKEYTANVSNIKPSLISIMNFSPVNNNFNMPQVSSSGRTSSSGSPMLWGVLIGGGVGFAYSKANDMDSMSTFLVSGMGAGVGALIVFVITAYRR